MKFTIENEKMVEVLKTAIGYEETADYWWNEYSESNETDNAALGYFHVYTSKARAILYAFEILTGIYVPSNTTSIRNIIDAIRTGEEIPQYV